VEDEQRVAELIKRGLEEHQFEVELAYDGTLGRRMALQYEYDAVIMDVILPQMNGIDLCKTVRAAKPHLPIILLTALGTTDDKIEGLDAGADDYLVKPFAVEELDARVEVLTRRAQRTREDCVQYGRLSWFGNEGRVDIAGQPLVLLPREFEVLGLLVRRAPRLVPKRALIDALAERNLELSDSAAEVYVSRLRRKLAGSGLAIRTLRGFGYVLEAEALP